MGADALTPSSSIATVLKIGRATIEGIQRGLADVKVGRKMSHEDAMASVRGAREAQERQAELDAAREREMELERQQVIEKEQDRIAERDRGPSHGL